MRLSYIIIIALLKTFSFIETKFLLIEIEDSDLTNPNVNENMELPPNAQIGKGKG